MHKEYYAFSSAYVLLVSLLQINLDVYTNHISQLKSILSLSSYPNCMFMISATLHSFISVVALPVKNKYLAPYFRLFLL